MAGLGAASEMAVRRGDHVEDAEKDRLLQTWQETRWGWDPKSSVSKSPPLHLQPASWFGDNGHLGSASCSLPV
jgi:hypothetical protein